MRLNDEEHCWKMAKICWIIAGIFAAIAIIGHILLLVMKLLGYE